MGAALRAPASMAARQAREVVEGQAGCTLAGRLVIGDAEMIAPLDPLPCPVTVACAECDDVLPLADYAEAVRARLPAAWFVVLPGVGHAAMVDDPDLVVSTVVTSAAVP